MIRRLLQAAVDQLKPLRRGRELPLLPEPAIPVLSSGPAKKQRSYDAFWSDCQLSSKRARYFRSRSASLAEARFVREAGEKHPSCFGQRAAAATGLQGGGKLRPIKELKASPS